MHAFARLARAPFARALLTDLEVVVFALAALGHDAGHRGFNNAFEVASRSPIAAANGGSGPVLERHHAAAVAAALAESGVLDGAAPEARAALLRTVNAASMATDLARHDAIVAELARAAADARGFASLSPDARVAALMHTADLSGQAFPRPVALAWSDLIADEFAAQAAAEATSGLATAPFMMGLESALARARMQAGFTRGVVLPLWRALADVAAGARDEPVLNIEANALHYAAERDRLAPAAGHAAVAAMPAAVAVSVPPLVSVPSSSSLPARPLAPLDARAAANGVDLDANTA